MHCYKLHLRHLWFYIVIWVTFGALSIVGCVVTSKPGSPEEWRGMIQALNVLGFGSIIGAACILVMEHWADATYEIRQ